ncbi:D-tyrosyl-tRNA(Tyr) deacylase [Xanthomonas oryzae pv. oryzae]|nr:D-tyrosyl-tRNA(Tyr) deacylase [Xanthomonas oryzae pv. oryzae]
MLALIQRVTRASVTVDDRIVGQIGPGLLALIGVEPGDRDAQTRRLAERLLSYRVFSDDAGKMNRSLTDTNGGLLLVSQFTLAADTSSGNRPGFSTAAPPEEAERAFNQLVDICREKNIAAGWKQGRFGAHMVVDLVNDGPVTFLLRP